MAVFQTLRDMDEIQVANFMIGDEVTADGQYDLVMGDESWELDYHLHENPNLKKAACAWLTDFVGYLPMPQRAEREAFVAADYNAEMIRQIERFGQIRDKAIFVGNPDDIVADRFGPDLPSIRDWTKQHYEFSGYVTGFDPVALGDRSELRAELGYAADERICIVAVEGSGVGVDLLRPIATWHRSLAGQSTICASWLSPDPESTLARCRRRNQPAAMIAALRKLPSSNVRGTNRTQRRNPEDDHDQRASRRCRYPANPGARQVSRRRPRPARRSPFPHRPRPRCPPRLRAGGG